MDDKAFLARLVPGYKGIAQNWECDINNHLNVSHFFGRSSDHAFLHATRIGPVTAANGGRPARHCGA